jgi:hypothetical protein
MILKIGAIGDDVRMLQLQLAAHGFRVGVVDGKFGPKVEAGVRAFQAARGIPSTGIVDAATWTELAKEPAVQVVPLPGVAFHDRRKFAAQSHHGYATRARPLSLVTGICLHQAAVDLGERPERYDTMGAHVGISRGGLFIWEHDWDVWVCAANGWNNGTISIEVSGRYCGIEGDERTYWRNPKNPQPPQQLTPEAETTLVQGIRWICSDVASAGGRITKLVAHRQSSADRPSDPGQAIWKATRPIAAELGLSDGGVGFKLGDGRPIPEDWDERCAGIKY